MRFLNWGKNKNARRTFRTDSKPPTFFNEKQRQRERAEPRRRSNLFSFPSLRRWFFGNTDNEPAFRVYHAPYPVPVKPTVPAPRTEIPDSYFRMVRVACRGRLRVPREAAKIGTKIVYPLRGCYRGFGEGTIVAISKRRAEIFVERPDGRGFRVAPHCVKAI